MDHRSSQCSGFDLLFVGHNKIQAASEEILVASVEESCVASEVVWGQNIATLDIGHGGGGLIIINVWKLLLFRSLIWVGLLDH